MALLYAAVFAALSALTLGLMLWLYRAEASAELNAALDRESSALTAAWQDDGAEGVRRYALVLRAQPLGERWSVVLTMPDKQVVIPESEALSAALPDQTIITRQIRLDKDVTARLRISTQVQREALRLLGRVLATGVVLLVVLALAGGVLLAWLTNRRISNMDKALAGIVEGRLSSRLPVRVRGDELDRLAANVNLALDRVEQLMDTVRSATDGIAHDLRTPMARHRARLEHALMTPPPAEELTAWLESTIEEVDHILATFRGLMQVATVEAGSLRNQFVNVDLSDLAQRIVDLYEPLASERGLRIDLVLKTDATVPGLPDLLSQTLANLLDNAIKFSPLGGEIRVAMYRAPDRVRLRVTDQGPGIPESEREHVFQRLYRLDASRSTPGLGLGLSLVRAVAELHDGEVVIEDNRPGTRVTLSLPRIATSASDQKSERRKRKPASRAATAANTA